MAGMDLGSPDTRLEEITDPQKEDGSILVGKLDLNLAVGKEEGGEGYGHETGGDSNRVDLNQLGPDGSPLFHAHVGCSEGPESSCIKSSSRVNTELDDGEVGGRTFDCDQERLQSPSKHKNFQGETIVLSGSYSHISSNPVEPETFLSEMRTGDSAQSSWKSSSIVDTNYQGEGTEKDSSEACRRYSPSHDERVGDYSGKLSGDLQHEKAESAYEEVERGATNHPIKELLAPEKTQYNDDETKKEGFYHSRKSPSEDGKLEPHHSNLHSPQRIPKRSVSLVRLMSVSPEISTYKQQSPHQKPSSSPQGVEDPSYSPRSSRHRRSPSHERLGGKNKRVPNQGHLSPTGQTSASPQRRSHQGSQHRDDMSPRRYNSPPDRRREDKSVLRSPIRRSDSSSATKRDYHHRSRSRSPYERDRYRRSPKRRYSPRHRSPYGNYSRRRSPRRRPWSPPPNRNTGVGRPGNTLFVAGFDFLTTERDLERKFSRFGRVRDVRIVRDKRSGDSRGFGFLSLERDEDADAAIRALDQTEWNGRVVLVEKSNTPAR